MTIYGYPTIDQAMRIYGRGFARVADEKEKSVKTYTMDQVKAAVNRAMDVLDVDYEPEDVVSFVERDLTGPYRAERTLSNCGLYPDMPWRVVDTTERGRTVAVCLYSGIASIVADALNERAAKC